MTTSVRHHGAPTMKRSGAAAVAALGRDREAERAEGGLDLGVGHVEAEHGVEARALEGDARLALRARVDVDRAAPRRAAADLDQQLRRAPRGVRGQLRREPALEARGGLAAQPQPRRGAADARRVELRGLQQHARRALGDLAVKAAHHAGEGDRAAVVGDQQRVVAQLADLAVERPQPLALACEAHDDRALQAVGVEGVQRVAEFEHDVVRHVDDVVDRALAGGAQALLHPARRGPDAHALDHGGDVAGTQIRVVDRDGGGLRDVGIALGVLAVREAQRRARDRGDLAGDAGHVHHVGAVRPGVHVQHHVAEVVGERRADRRVRGQLEDALVLLGQAQLALGQHHPRGLDAANARGLERRGPRRCAGRPTARPRARRRRAVRRPRSARRRRRSEARPAPYSTVASTSRSAFGCGSTASTSATVTRSRSQPPTRSMPSTSAEAIVSRSANASTSRSSGRST